MCKKTTQQSCNHRTKQTKAKLIKMKSDAIGKRNTFSTSLHSVTVAMARAGRIFVTSNTRLHRNRMRADAIAHSFVLSPAHAHRHNSQTKRTKRFIRRTQQQKKKKILNQNTMHMAVRARATHLPFVRRF